MFSISMTTRPNQKENNHKTANSDNKNNKDNDNNESEILHKDRDEVHAWPAKCSTRLDSTLLSLSYANIFLYFFAWPSPKSKRLTAMLHI